MTDAELAKLYYEAVHNSVVYGTGFIKVAMVDGAVQASIVEPRDYKYIEPIQAEEDK